VGSNRQHTERERDDEDCGEWEKDDRKSGSLSIGFPLHHRAGAEVESWCVLWLVLPPKLPFPFRLIMVGSAIHSSIFY